MYLQDSFILEKSVPTRILGVWLGMLTQAYNSSMLEILEGEL